MRRWTRLVGAADIAIVSLAVVVYMSKIVSEGFLVLSAGLALLAIVTFFGSLEGLRAPNQRLDEGELRSAITVSTVVTYLVMVGLVTFYQGTNNALPELARTVIGSFTATIGVVVAFFFGSSAYVQARRQSQGGDTGTSVQTQTSASHGPGPD